MQTPGYFPIRYQSGTQFAQGWTFLTANGSPQDISGFSGWALTLYDTAGGTVRYAASGFTHTQSGSPTVNVDTASATSQPLVPAGVSDFGYYALTAVVSAGQAPEPLMHGPYVIEP